MIDKTAIIDKNANLADNVHVGPYVIIEAGVQIGQGCKIASHSIIRKGTILEENILIDSFAVLGGLPQDRNFDPNIESGVKIGKGVVIREGATVHRSSNEGCFTTVGEDSILMTNSHIAHDCKIGKNVNLVNGTLLGGHVSLGDYSYIGGNAVVHQSIRIGNGTILAGRAAINLDIPPFLMASEVNRIHGLNIIGIKRRGFNQESIGDLKQCLHIVFGEAGNPFKKAKLARESGLGNTELGKTFLQFFENRGTKGCIHSRHFQHKNNA